MTIFRAIGRAWDVAQETTAAVQAARAVLEAGGSPVGALRAFAAATDGQLDDQVVAELERGLRRVVEGLALTVQGMVVVATALNDPRVRATLERAITTAIDVGYAASGWRVTLERWLRENPPVGSE